MGKPDDRVKRGEAVLSGSGGGAGAERNLRPAEIARWGATRGYEGYGGSPAAQGRLGASFSRWRDFQQWRGPEPPVRPPGGARRAVARATAPGGDGGGNDLAQRPDSVLGQPRPRCGRQRSGLQRRGPAGRALRAGGAVPAASARPGRRSCAPPRMDSRQYRAARPGLHASAGVSAGQPRAGCGLASQPGGEGEQGALARRSGQPGAFGDPGHAQPQPAAAAGMPMVRVSMSQGRPAAAIVSLTTALRCIHCVAGAGRSSRTGCQSAFPKSGLPAAARLSCRAWRSSPG